MKQEIDVDSLLEKGDTRPIKEWLAKNDFAYDYLNPNDWIKKVVGQEIDPSYFIEYLREKFLK